MAETSTTPAPAPPKKHMHLNFFENAGCGSHMATGQWKDPSDNSRFKDRLDYYIWLAKLADKGKITSIFFADSYGVHQTFNNRADEIFAAGSQVANIDPVTLVSAMAAVTKSVAFGITGSTSYITPFLLARTWASLDHVTRGRVAWNVVTSYSTSAAKVMGREDVMPSEERYKAAHEYMDLCYKMWEYGWEDDVQKWSIDPEIAYDPKKIHRIEYEGQYHKMSGFFQTHPSPQRTPVIFQAGASKSGIAFAGKHAEAIYTDYATFDTLKAYTKQVRESAITAGRDPSTIKIFAATMPIIGRTMEEAQAKYDKALGLTSSQGGMAKFSSYTNTDLGKFALDEEFKFEAKAADNAITGVINGFMTAAAESTEPWTPRYLGTMAGFGGTTPKPMGTPEMVADVFEKWWRECDIDGFNIAYVSNPGSYEDVVELLVPELQKRGLMWDDYLVPGGTFRENLQNTPGQPHLGKDHPGYQHKWPKKTEGSEVKATLEVVETTVETTPSSVVENALTGPAAVGTESVKAAESEVKNPEPVVVSEPKAEVAESEEKSPETVIESEVKPTPVMVA